MSGATTRQPCPACDKHKAGLCSKLWEWSKPSPNLGGVAGMMSMLFTQDKAILENWEGKREDPDARTCIYIFFFQNEKKPLEMTRNWSKHILILGLPF